MDSPTRTKRRMPVPVRIRFTLNVIIVLMFAAAAWEARDFVSVSRFMPQYMSTAGAIIGVLLLAIDWTKYRKVGLLKADEAIGDSIFAVDDDGQSDEARLLERAAIRRALEIWGYLFLFVGLIAVVGLTAGTAIWLVLVLRFLPKFTWRQTLVSVVAVVGGIQLIRSGMNLIFPTYFIEQWVTLDFRM